MSQRCENCGQMVLEDETSCWQCGWQRMELMPEADEKLRQRADESTKDALSLKVIAAYAGVTLVVFILLMIVMDALGRRPLVLTSSELLVDADWVVVGDAETFLLNLPPNWNWHRKANPSQQQVFTGLVDSAPYLNAVIEPFGEAGAPMELVAFGTAPGAVPSEGILAFVLVAVDTRHQPLPPNAVRVHLEERPDLVSVLNASITTDDAGHPVSQLQIEIPLSTVTLRCQGNFLSGPRSSLLVAACADGPSFPANSSDLQKLLSSFRTLQP